MFNSLIDSSSIIGAVLLFVALCALGLWLAGVRLVAHDRIAIVEKRWSQLGSLAEGRIIAVRGEAGFQSRVLRGGLHFFLYPWQYRLHYAPLVVVAENRIGYVYARDGDPLDPSQTLGRVTACNHFMDANAFLLGGGQRGRQRDILREGVYAINPAQFVVITEDQIYAGPDTDRNTLESWRRQLIELNAFAPIVVGHGENTASRARNANAAAHDVIGIVTVHDGPQIESGQIIASEVRASGTLEHNYFQNPEAFLQLGGRRGKQLQVLTDGTFFINRWFATVEIAPKTMVPIGYVGVVVSYHGAEGEDVTGENFRYGAQVAAGQRGVWKHALPTGKYPLNPYAQSVELVPTINFVLRWIDNQTEHHQYDRNLRSIQLITADGYEPILPLSLVLHIDYQNAPSVVQRFGDVERLITQTLDPILAAYFRDVAQKSTMLDLITRREEIQRVATEELGKRFQHFDINCIAVLIGRPESSGKYDQQDDPVEHLLEQLRTRRLAEEQVSTFAKQQEAADKLRQLNDAEAAAAKQAELTQTRIEVEIAQNRGEATLAEARRLSERDVVRAQGESSARELIGKGEAARVAQVGAAEADVFEQKVQAFRDPRLFALQQVAERLAQSNQPLVPDRLVSLSGAAEGSAGLPGVLSQLFASLLAGQELNAETNESSRESSAEAKPASLPAQFTPPEA